MPFSTLFLSGATVGMTTLAFAISTPASAQEPYTHKHYVHAHYRHYAHYHEGRQIIVHPQATAPVQNQGYAGGLWRRSATSWWEPARPCRASLPAPAPLWAGSWAECLAARRRSSGTRTTRRQATHTAGRRATHTAPLSLRRSMRPGQWPHHRSRPWAALS